MAILTVPEDITTAQNHVCFAYCTTQCRLSSDLANENQTLRYNFKVLNRLLLLSQGVLVGNSDLLKESSNACISVANGYLQKPSIAEMEDAGAFLLQTRQEDDVPKAMIDTGVVIATGKAFEV